MTFKEPNPPKAQLTAVEQKRIIRAALNQLNLSALEIVPHPNDDWTLLQHFELIALDSLGDTYAIDAVPRLFRDMSEAALSELLIISAERDIPFSDAN